MVYSNPDVEPWYPDTVYPGTPPTATSRGERGSDAFQGNAGYNTDGTPKNRAVPPRGPATGADYYPDGIGSTTTPIATGVQTAAVSPQPTG